MARASNASRLIDALREPIAPAFVAAAAVHALLLLALGFSFTLPEKPLRSIAVTVSLTPSTKAPEEARHVAADNQLGAQDAGAQAPETRLVMQTSLTVSRELAIDDGDGQADPSRPDDLARELNQLREELASLSDSEQRNNPRAGSVAARRALDADYLARWRGRVEQVGNALYRGEPPAGDGDVRLLVTVLADGTLEQIRVLQSSGIASLDQAAQDTVVLAAPFPPFSASLARQTARLEIIRTWQFRTQAVSSP